MSQEQPIILKYDGREYTITFKKPNVGKMNDVFKKTLKIKFNQDPELDLENYINEMIISCLDGLPFKTVEEIRACNDYDFYLELAKIINQRIPIESFFQKIETLFSKKL